jgi:hypothetical protein
MEREQDDFPIDERSGWTEKTRDQKMTGEHQGVGNNTRRLERTILGMENEEDWNGTMKRAWQDQRGNKRDIEAKDEPDENEIHSDNLMRECKLLLEGNCGNWERRTKEEGKIKEKEEKQTWLEMMERKKKKYGKAGNKS